MLQNSYALSSASPGVPPKESAWCANCNTALLHCTGRTSCSTSMSRSPPLTGFYLRNSSPSRSRNPVPGTVLGCPMALASQHLNCHQSVGVPSAQQLTDLADLPNPSTEPSSLCLRVRCTLCCPPLNRSSANSAPKDIPPPASVSSSSTGEVLGPP